jgi:hypothetical protein
MLGSDALLAAAELGVGPAFVERFENILHLVLPLRPPAGGGRNVMPGFGLARDLAGGKWPDEVIFRISASTARSARG